MNNSLLDPRICISPLETKSLKIELQKVGWKTLEREKLLCIRESVVQNPILTHENRLAMCSREDA